MPRNPLGSYGRATLLTQTVRGLTLAAQPNVKISLLKPSKSSILLFTVNYSEGLGDRDQNKTPYFFAIIHQIIK